MLSSDCFDEIFDNIKIQLNLDFGYLKICKEKYDIRNPKKLVHLIKKYKQYLPDKNILLDICWYNQYCYIIEYLIDYCFIEIDCNLFNSGVIDYKKKYNECLPKFLIDTYKKKFSIEKTYDLFYDDRFINILNFKNGYHLFYYTCIENEKLRPLLINQINEELKKDDYTNISKLNKRQIELLINFVDDKKKLILTLLKKE